MKVLKIGAIWCNICNVMRPRFEEIEKENPWLKTEYFDFDKDKEVLKKHNLESESQKLPIFIFLDKDNKEILRLRGEVEKQEIVKLINEYKDK